MPASEHGHNISTFLALYYFYLRLQAISIAQLELCKIKQFDHVQKNHVPPLKHLDSNEIVAYKLKGYQMGERSWKTDTLVLHCNTVLLLIMKKDPSELFVSLLSLSFYVLAFTHVSTLEETW